MGEIDRIKEMASVVLNDHEDYPDHRRPSDFSSMTWDDLRAKFRTPVGLLSYMEQRGYRIGRECAFHDYLYANGLKLVDSRVVPVDGSENGLSAKEE